MNFLKYAVGCYGWLVLLLALSQPVAAVEVSGVFSAELIANNESSDARNYAIRQGLFAVLDRVVITEDIAQIPAVQQMLQNAQQYVKQSQFLPLPADDYADTSARLLRVEFDENQVLDELRRNQLGIWTEIRPQTLVWLVVDEGAGWQFYNSDTMPDIESGLALIAKIKGIPLIYPLLDLEEQQKIAVNDVLTTESRNLKTASARYEVPSILVGRLLKKANCWQGSWESYFDGKVRQWHTGCLALKPVIQTGVRGVYDVLSNYYGIKADKAATP